MTEPRVQSIPLLPRPRLLLSQPGTTDLTSMPRVRFDPHNLTRPCEHTIRATDTIEIVARDEEALRAANATLKQLTRQDTRFQAFEIHDWAAFERRGFMLDVSRDRIPTMEHLNSLVEMLASLKFNHLQLYFEHTFAFARHEQIWHGLDPITPEQIRELDLLCIRHGIELTANQNCFGHLSHWLSHPAYAQLAETHGVYDFYGMRRAGPFSLNPGHPGSSDLIRDLLTQLRACHTSNRINIGCDEVADLGTGESEDLVNQLGYGRVYSQFVIRVAELCTELGFQPMFWADVTTNHPDCLDLLPRDLTALVWGYEPDTPFAGSLEQLCARGFASWVCPGTSCWRSFAGRTTERRSNISNAANIGAAHNCQGLLLTSWGDLGHRQQWPITLRAIADGAAAAWSGNELADLDAVDLHVYNEPGSETSDWLDTLGDADLFLREAQEDQNLPRLLNASALFHELHPAHESLPSRGDLADWEQVRVKLDDLNGRFPIAGDQLLCDELQHALECCRFACDTAIMRRGGPPAAGLDNIIAEHQKLWAVRSRLAGLEASTAYYIKLRNELEQDTLT